MNLLYDGKIIGTITTNRFLTVDECISILGIDIDATDGGDPVYDYDLFSMDYDAPKNAGAILGSSRSPKKTAAARINGKLGGRPRKQ